MTERKTLEQTVADNPQAVRMTVWGDDLRGLVAWTKEAVYANAELIRETQGLKERIREEQKRLSESMTRGDLWREQFQAVKGKHADVKHANAIQRYMWLALIICAAAGGYLLHA